MRTPSLMSPTAGSDSIATCIRTAALAAASGLEKSAITESPMVSTTRPPVASADRRSLSRQRPMASAAGASPAASYRFVLPVTLANRTVVCRLSDDVSTNRLRSPVAEAAARRARELGDAYLELALLQGLSERRVFAVRHRLRRDRRAQLVGPVSARQSAKLALGQPGVFFA